MKTIQDIRKSTGLNRRNFCDALHIPYRTVEDWEKGVRNCPEYVTELIEYRVQNDPLFKKEE